MKAELNGFSWPTLIFLGLGVISLVMALLGM